MVCCPLCGSSEMSVQPGPDDEDQYGCEECGQGFAESEVIDGADAAWMQSQTFAEEDD